MNIKTTGLFVIVVALLLTSCTTATQEVPDIDTPEPTKEAVDDKPIVEKEWTTYINSEYGFEIDYPSTLGGNAISISQTGNKFAVTGLNGFDSEFEIPFTVALDIQSEDDLDAFIKKQYFPECELAEVYYDDSDTGLYPVDIHRFGSIGNGCWINWISLLRYSPEKQKAVAIDLGQEPPMFEKVDGEFVDYSRAAADTFRFVD